MTTQVPTTIYDTETALSAHGVLLAALLRLTRAGGVAQAVIDKEITVQLNDMVAPDKRAAVAEYMQQVTSEPRA